MVNADITKFSAMKLDYLFCIIGIRITPFKKKEDYKKKS